MSFTDQIPEIALKWHHEGQGAAIATVVETWGSAPRRIGSQLAISGDGQIEGSVSGGCVEGAVIIEAQDTIAKGKGTLLTFGVSDDQAFAVGLACGGTIKVMVQPVGSVLNLAVLEGLCQARANREPAAITTDFSDFSSQMFDQTELANPELAERFRSDKSGMVSENQFISIHNPPLRLAVVGAVHIAQTLVEMARMTGYDVMLIDPRESFATKQRFPNDTISHEWPDAALFEWGLDQRTAVVTLTHDPKIDDPAIMTALSSTAFYIGCLGSKRTHAKRLDRLADAGFDAQTCERIHGPVGLDIGAKSPAEIAVSVMAELTSALRKSG
jgi:xanthine dehydrogenase accessory factor